MANFNRVFLLGRLTKDPESSKSKEGNSITRFDFACDNGYGENKKPMFIGVTAFGKTADFVQKYFKKGNEILIEGSLDYQTWDDKDTGKKRSKHAVIANQVMFAGSNKSEEKEALKEVVKDAKKAISDGVTDDEIPF